MLVSRSPRMSSSYVTDLLARVKANPAEPEFHQAVEEVLENLVELLTDKLDCCSCRTAISKPKTAPTTGSPANPC